MSLGEVRSWPAHELLEWQVFCESEPLPDPFWIGAQISCVIANAHRAKGRAFRIDDFLPQMRPRPARRRTTAELMAAFRAAVPSAKITQPKTGKPNGRHR